MFNFCVWCGMLAKVSEETKMTLTVIHVLLEYNNLFLFVNEKKTTNKQKCQNIKDIFKKGFSRS